LSTGVTLYHLKVGLAVSSHFNLWLDIEIHEIWLWT
jgi:hypothetical protein